MGFKLNLKLTNNIFKVFFVIKKTFFMLKTFVIYSDMFGTKANTYKYLNGKVKSTHFRFVRYPMNFFRFFHRDGSIELETYTIYSDFDAMNFSGVLNIYFESSMVKYIDSYLNSRKNGVSIQLNSN